MIRKDKIIMSVKELRRLDVIHQVIDRKMTQGTAGGILGLTDRQAGFAGGRFGFCPSESRESVPSAD